MHFMLEEIRSESAIVENYKAKEFDNFENILRILAESDVIYAVGNGTSYHAALYLSILLNRTGQSCFPVFSSETDQLFLKKGPKMAAIVFSQSGGSVDAINSVEELKRVEARVIGITNIPNSELDKRSDFKINTDVGKEESLAATKSHLSQLLVSLKIALHGKNENLDALMGDIERYAGMIISKDTAIRRLAERSTANTVFLGSGLLYPVALEASLKLMETSNAISYAFPTREFLHGPKQILDKNWSVFMFSRDNKVEKDLNQYAKSVLDVTDFMKEEYGISKINEVTWSILLLIFGQLFAYYSSIYRGLNPDKPSKLSKVVK